MKLSRTAILNLVGLTPRHIGDAMPKLSAFREREGVRLAHVEPVLPAVTSTVQATYLTGRAPGEHGIVANGWYDRDFDEHRFWKQSNRLVQGRKLWETLRESRPDFTCAKLFWWNNMYSTVDYSITPRPVYAADGAKYPDITSHPLDLAGQVKRKLGDFPFMNFWGPVSGIESSNWIGRAALWIEKHHQPDLSLVYLPHLDYPLQRLGPNDPSLTEDLNALDSLFGQMLKTYDKAGVEVVVLSEYGITEVTRPVHLNRLFRTEGWLAIKPERGRETLELGDSQAFAIADHQVAHIYVREPQLIPAVRALLEKTEGVEQVVDPARDTALGLDHERSGDLIAIADADSWFTYYFWDDDKVAPDYARTVDIHRKPGYDPVELFFDPKLSHPKVRVARRLLAKKVGFRTLLDVIPLDAALVRGSHGRLPDKDTDRPVLMGKFPDLEDGGHLHATEVHDHLLAHCGGD